MCLRWHAPPRSSAVQGGVSVEPAHRRCQDGRVRVARRNLSITPNPSRFPGDVRRSGRGEQPGRFGDRPLHQECSAEELWRRVRPVPHALALSDPSGTARRAGNGPPLACRETSGRLVRVCSFYGLKRRNPLSGRLPSERCSSGSLGIRLLAPAGGGSRRGSSWQLPRAARCVVAWRRLPFATDTIPRLPTRCGRLLSRRRNPRHRSSLTR